MSLIVKRLIMGVRWLWVWDDSYRVAKTHRMTLVVAGLFSQKSHLSQGSFAENDLKDKASYDSTPLCTWCETTLITLISDHTHFKHPNTVPHYFMWDLHSIHSFQITCISSAQIRFRPHQKLLGGGVLTPGPLLDWIDHKFNKIGILD